MNDVRHILAAQIVGTVAALLATTRRIPDETAERLRRLIREYDAASAQGDADEAALRG